MQKIVNKNQKSIYRPEVREPNKRNVRWINGVRGGYSVEAKVDVDATTSRTPQRQTGLRLGIQQVIPTTVQIAIIQMQRLYKY